MGPYPQCAVRQREYPSAAAQRGFVILVFIPHLSPKILRCETRIVPKTFKETPAPYVITRTRP